MNMLNPVQLTLPGMPPASRAQRPEQFHANTAQVTGQLQRLWLDGDTLLCRLQPDGQSGLLTLNFQGTPNLALSLAPGVRVRATGYLRDFEIRESLAEALGREWP